MLPMNTQQPSATIRRQLIRLLEAESCGVRELSQMLHQSEQEVYQHLRHVEHSLRTAGKQLQVEPSVCLHCGFVFSERTRTSPPGRCPRCRKTHIRRPQFRIVANKQ